MKHTRRIILCMIKDSEKGYSTKELINSTGLKLDQVKMAVRFLKNRRLIKVKHIKTNTVPYRGAIYSLKREMKDYYIKLLRDEGIDI